jgi:(p)ppGpp synthase/HD superfamily hydrolase
MGALIEHARMWGAMKHKNQVRKHTGEAYFMHCEAVAELVKTFYEEVLKEPVPEEVIAAALLHDVVEDTDATFEMLQDICGEETTRLVYYLTKPIDVAGNRAQKKALYHNKLSLAPETARIIKFFDMMHNHSSIKLYDPELWETWKEETKRAIAAMEIHNIRGGVLMTEYNEFIEAL